MRKQPKFVLLALLGGAVAGLVFLPTAWRSHSPPPRMATVETDKSDYVPKSTARISGRGFQPKESVVLHVQRVDGVQDTAEDRAPWIVQASDAGDFLTEWRVCDCLGSTLLLTAVGGQSRMTATASFTDGVGNTGLLQGWFDLLQQWGGTLQSSNSRYGEGDAIPIRFTSALAPGSQHTIVLKYDFSSGGTQRFFDSLGSYNATIANANLTAGISGVGSHATKAIPADTSLRTGAQVPGVFTLYNIDPASISFGPYGVTNGIKGLSMTFTVVSGKGSTTNIIIGYGGHLASANVWGAGNGAINFPGASRKAYISFDGSSDQNISINPNALALDTTPPVITCPADIIVNTAANQCSATVTYTVTATDDSGSVTVTSNPPSGSVFPKGTNVVVCTATDPSTNTSTCSFRVIVRDAQAPQIACPANIVQNTDPGKCSAVVNYAVTATDNCGGTINVVGTPASGSAFPLGTTTVKCVATDASGNTNSCSFTVTIQDKQFPQIVCPADIITTNDVGICGARVTFANPSATDNCSGNVNIVCAPASGTVLPMGTNLVTCTATDAAGNQIVCFFRVIVLDPNQSWPSATKLNLLSDSQGTQTATIKQCLNTLDESVWYKFRVLPGSHLIVTLTGLPENYDLALFKDIAAAYSQLTSTADLTRLSAEFAGDVFSPSAFSSDMFSPSAFSPSAFSPSAFSPSAFSPSAFSPSAFSPSAFSPSAFSPDAYAPSAFSPSAFSPSAFSPSAFSPSAFSPSAFSPSAFSAAQVQSILAVSAFDGIAGEGVLAESWGNTGDFYIRVRGRNGVCSPGNPFTVTVYQIPSSCGTITTVGPASTTAAPAGNYKTIILTDMNRWLGTADKTAISNKLATLATRSDVKGVIVDVGADPAVAFFNAQADSHFDCPLAKNLVANAIKAIVNRSRAGNALQYVVLVGNDSVIPFFRFPDEALLGPERNYVPPVKDLTASQASLRLNYVLNQDVYGAQCELSLKTVALPLPDLAVGRLAESTNEVSGMIDAYLSTTGGVISPSNSLVTGYDFLADDAQAVASEFALGMGKAPDTLICPGTSAPSLCWTADDLRQALFSKRHDLIFLAGHFSASEALAADYTTHMFAAELAASSTDFKNAIVFSAGCHSGYNIVDADDINLVTAEPDWVQACIRKQATVLAGTGYQYGDTDFIEYSERFYLEFAKQLRTGNGAITIGQALLKAKQAYLAATPEMRGIHTKAYLEGALFGLPMLSVNMTGGTRRMSDVTTPIVTSVQNASGNPGAFLGLKFADATINPALTPTTLTLANTEDNTQVMATYLAGGDGVINNPAEPILPLEVRNVSVNGVVLRGIGFRGGAYTDRTNTIPLTGAPTTAIRGVHATFLSEVFYPMRPWSANYFGALCGGLDGVTRLMAIPAQFKSDSAIDATGTLRQFTGMDFRLFYSSNITTYTDNNGPSTPALAAPPAISAIQGITSPAGDSVAFSVNVIGNPAAGIQAVWVTYTATNGLWATNWKSLDLTQDAVDTRVWKGTLPLAGTASQSVRYMVQAVNGVGAVALDTKLGAYHIPDEFDGSNLANLPPTTVTLQTPVPTAGPYGSTVTLKALLTSGGNPVPQKRMVFSIGQQELWTATDANGFAIAKFPLRNQPGAYQLTASFPGASGLAPSFASAPFTVNMATTALTLPAPPRYAWLNSDSGIFATLKDGSNNVISERTLVFTVTGQNGNYGRSIMTDINGKSPLGVVPLPVGTYNVNAYFNGLIPFPGGQTVSNWDGLYFSSSASSQLIIEGVQSITASPNILSPPNHQMVTVTITVNLSSNAGTVTSQIIKVTSSDPTNTTGDGNTAGDWYFVDGSLTVQLRAERSQSGVGRTYTIYVQSTDSSGNVTTGTTTVFVPPNQ